MNQGGEIKRGARWINSRFMTYMTHSIWCISFYTQLEGAALMTLVILMCIMATKPLQGTQFVTWSLVTPHPSPPLPPSHRPDFSSSSRQSGVQFNQSFAETAYLLSSLAATTEAKLNTQLIWSPTACLPPYSTWPLSHADAYRPNSGARVSWVVSNPPFPPIHSILFFPLRLTLVQILELLDSGDHCWFDIQF